MYIVDVPDAPDCEPLIYSLKSVSSFWQAQTNATAMSANRIFLIILELKFIAYTQVVHIWIIIGLVNPTAILETVV